MFQSTGGITTTGAGTAVIGSTPGRTWGLQMKAAGGTLTSWTVVLQVSLDGTNFFTVLTHTNTSNADGDIVFAVDKPAHYARYNVTALSLGSATSVTATWLGVN